MRYGLSAARRPPVTQSVFAAGGRRAVQPMVGIENWAPARVRDGQRDVTVLRWV